MRVSERRNRRRKELGHSVHLFYDCSRALGDAGNASLAVDPNNTRPASPTSPRPRSDVRRLAPFGGARLATRERGGGELDHANVTHATCLFTMAGRVSGCNLAFVKWHLGRCGGRDVPPNPARPVGDDDIICKSRKSVRRYYSYFWRGPAPAQTFQTATIITASPRHTSTSIIYVQVNAQSPP